MTKKQALDNPTQARLKFVELTAEESDDHVSMFTDGSVNQDHHTAACAIHIPKLSINNSWKLNKFTCVHSAELCAINKALTEFSLSDFQYMEQSSLTPSHHYNLSWHLNKIMS